MRLPPASKNITARRLVNALKRDGFQLTTGRKGVLIFRHPDGRKVEVHFHHAGQTFPPKTLKAMLDDAGWTLEDLHCLKLMKR